MKRRLLAILLAVAMCAVLVPTIFFTSARAGGRDVILVDEDGTYHRVSKDDYGDGWSFAERDDVLTLNGYHGRAIYGYFKKLVLAPGSENSLSALSVYGWDSEFFRIEGLGTLTLEFDKQLLKNTHGPEGHFDLWDIFGETAPYAFILKCSLQDGKPECKLRTAGISIAGGSEKGDAQPLNFVDHGNAEKESVLLLAETSDGIPASYIRISPAPPLFCSPTSNKLIIDGVETTPVAYVINGNNYFKLRDVAALLNGTSAQFDVGYDVYSKAILITKGMGYQKLPSDLQNMATGNQIANPTEANLKIGTFIINEGSEFSGSVTHDDSETLDAYTINGYTYFKLRDLGRLLNFEVRWDVNSKSVVIETDKPFTGK